MTHSSHTKCNIIRNIHCLGMTHESNADLEGASAASVKRFKTEFLDVTGLKCRTNPVNDRPYFGDTSDLLGALDFPREKIERIYKVLVEEDLFTSDLSLSLFKVFDIFREVVTDPEDWVRTALFHLALDSMIAELIEDSSWKPFADDSKPDLSRFDAGGKYGWLVSYVRENSGATMEEMRSYARETNQRGGHSDSTLSVQLRAAGFRKKHGRWVETTTLSEVDDAAEPVQTADCAEDSDGGETLVECAVEVPFIADAAVLLDSGESENAGAGVVLSDADIGIDVVASCSLRSDCSAELLRRQANNCRDNGKRSRMLAIASLYDGQGIKCVANQHAVNERTIRRWVERFNRFGVEGLGDKKKAADLPN